MSSERKTAVTAGAFFIIAAVTAVTGLALYGPVLHDPHYVLRAAGGDGRVLAGAICEILLAALMYRSRLVPRAIAVIGLVGGPLIFLSSFGVLLGAYPQLSPAGSLPAVPVAVWEMSLAVWMIARGFRSPASAPRAVSPRPAAPSPR